jgi:hypothetical protein
VVVLVITASATSFFICGELHAPVLVAGSS